MSDTPQNSRPLRIAISGIDLAGMVLTNFEGKESLSRLSRYRAKISVPVNATFHFSDLVGKAVNVAVHQTGLEERFLHGIIRRVSQGKRDDRFQEYALQIVPELWVLTRRKRSRLFQQMTTEEILRKVLGGLYAKSGPVFKLEATYHPRNITAQYNETDFDFLSRLMEEEGIYYFFTHTAEAPGIVFSDNPRAHIAIPGNSLLQFQDVSSNATAEGRVTSWKKAQKLLRGGIALTDHTFEMPTNDLQILSFGLDSIKAGIVDYPLNPAGIDGGTDIHPGGYARWRDGIDQGGGERPDDVPKVFDDIGRIGSIRAESETSTALQIRGASTCNALTPGHKFKLFDHFDADGEYVLTSVNHRATCGAATSGAEDFKYDNEFACMPLNLPFRPARTTKRPIIRGTQTAEVVGSEGAEIDPDKYGRVKVWLRWDPEGRRQLDTSCWVRVAQFWAGKQWGAQFLPRIGDEVIVSFLNGSPDEPIIIGSVYNADNMPIFDLPQNKTKSGIKTHSSPGGESKHYNEIFFEDLKGKELIGIHAERNMNTVVEAAQLVSVGASRTVSVADSESVSIGTDPKADPHKHGKSTTTIFGDTKLTISKGDYSFDVATGFSKTHVKGFVDEAYDDTWQVAAKLGIRIESTDKGIFLIAKEEINLKVGESSLEMKKDGTIKLKGKAITIEGTDDVTSMVGSQIVELTKSAVQVAGTKIDVAATAICAIAGALVKINC